MGYTRAKKPMEAGFHYGTLPPFYFTDQGSPINQNLQLLYDNFNHEALHGEVIEEGDIVKVIQSTPDGKAKVELWIDLSKGSNPVRIETTENSDALTNRNVVSWEWTQINNVWVPKKLTSVGASKIKMMLPASCKERLLGLKSSELPLPNDQFTLSRLGLRRGDRVRDTRKTDTTYVVEGANFPSATESLATTEPRPRSKTIWVVINVLIIIVLIALIYRWRARSATTGSSQSR